MNLVPGKRRYNSNSKPPSCKQNTDKKPGQSQSDPPTQTTTCKSKQHTEMGIRSKNKSKVKSNKNGAPKTDNEQKRKGLYTEKKSNDWPKHNEPHQKWGRHWSNLTKQPRQRKLQVTFRVDLDQGNRNTHFELTVLSPQCGRKAMGTGLSNQLGGRKLYFLGKRTYQKGGSAPWCHHHIPRAFLRAVPQSHQGPPLPCDPGSYSWNHDTASIPRPRPHI